MNKLSAEHAIKKQILETANTWLSEVVVMPTLDNEETIDKTWDSLKYDVRDITNEFRENFDENNPSIECQWSRHYESKSVAKQLDNGDWVGYTYWYGGGKHGDPESIDWIEYAYYLNCEEKEVTKIKRTFTPIKND